MNNKEMFQEKIKELVISGIKTEVTDIAFDADLREYGMDSVNCIILIVAIEDLYNFEFADEDLVLKNFVTINNLVEYVSNRLSQLT